MTDEVISICPPPRLFLSKGCCVFIMLKTQIVLLSLQLNEPKYSGSLKNDRCAHRESERSYGQVVLVFSQGVAGLCSFTNGLVHNGNYIQFKTNTHCKENPIYIFLSWELRGLGTNFHIHVSVNDLYTVFLGSVHIFPCSRIGRRILEIYKSFTDIPVYVLGDRTLLFCFGINNFISGNTSMGTNHLYWILTGPSFAVQLQPRSFPIRQLKSADTHSGSVIDNLGFLL